MPIFCRVSRQGHARRATLLVKEGEREKGKVLETCGRGRGKIFEKTSPFRQEVVIEYGSI